MIRQKLSSGLFVALWPNPAVSSDAPVKDFVLVDVPGGRAGYLDALGHLQPT
jgi:hypothetical protein